MKTVFFSSDIDTIDEWRRRHQIDDSLSCSNLDELQKLLNEKTTYIIIVDYDTVAHDINSLISSNTLPKNVIILERTPEITTGKTLISHGIKAYGNSRMMSVHYFTMIDTVKNAKVWTYPELTAALIQETKKDILSDDAQSLLNKRLSNKEKEVVFLILNGLTNNAIATELNITTRTVKAHVSSVFSKLHVNDRIALVLLLK